MVTTHQSSSLSFLSKKFKGQDSGFQPLRNHKKPIDGDELSHLLLLEPNQVLTEAQAIEDNRIRPENTEETPKGSPLQTTTTTVVELEPQDSGQNSFGMNSENEKNVSLGSSNDCNPVERRCTTAENQAPVASTGGYSISFGKTQLPLSSQDSHLESNNPRTNTHYHEGKEGSSNVHRDIHASSEASDEVSLSLKENAQNGQNKENPLEQDVNAVERRNGIFSEPGKLSLKVSSNLSELADAAGGKKATSDRIDVTKEDSDGEFDESGEESNASSAASEGLATHQISNVASSSKLSNLKSSARTKRANDDNSRGAMDPDKEVPSSSSQKSDTKPATEKLQALSTDMKSNHRSGRTKLKPKKLKNSLAGVGEIISSTSNLSAMSNPRKNQNQPNTATTESNPPVVLFKENQGLLGNKTANKKKKAKAKATEDMSDMIWWSTGREAVEIIAVKSGGYEEVWREQQRAAKEERKMQLADTAETEEREGKVGRRGQEEDGGERIDMRDDAEPQDVGGALPNSRQREVKSSRKGRKRLQKLLPNSEIRTSGSELSDAQCDFVVDNGPFCNDVPEDDQEEVGCKTLAYDLRDMMTEFVKEGPIVVVKWLD